jgi:hypothetical protein
MPKRTGRPRAALLLGFAGRRFNPHDSVGIWRHQRSEAAGVDIEAPLCADLAFYAHRRPAAVTKSCHNGHFRPLFSKPLFPLFPFDDQRLISLT